MALTEQFANHGKMIMFGGVFGVVASISAICNSMASHGVKTWKRLFLLPWLLFYSSLLVFLLMLLGYSLYCLRAEWKHVFLLFAIVSVFTCWRHMQRQYLLMSQPRPHSLVIDVETVMRELLDTDSSSHYKDLSKDCPPKYEDLEELPPKYDATTMTSDATFQPDVKWWTLLNHYLLDTRDLLDEIIDVIKRIQKIDEILVHFPMDDTTFQTLVKVNPQVRVSGKPFRPLYLLHKKHIYLFLTIIKSS